MYLDLALARGALRSGARGFIQAGMAPGQRLRALEVALEGEIVAPRQLLEYLIATEEFADLDILSARQREILELVSEGLTAGCVKVDPCGKLPGMKAYSKDLRLKVLDAVDRGMPRKEVATIFGISLPSIKRWLKLRRESGDVEPSPIPGPPARKGAVLEEWPPARLENEPDLTLQEHCEAFEEASGVKVSTATMSRRISGLPGGWPLKKSPR